MGIPTPSERDDSRRAPWVARVTERARAQYGLITTAQLLEHGVSRPMTRLRVRGGMLTPVHRGVYLVGPGPLGVEGRWLAAVLSGGPGCVLSHSSAGALWGICDPTGPVHVLRTRSRAGVRQQARRTVRPSGFGEMPGRPVFHGSMAIRDEDVTRRRGIPVTGVPRTLIDLAALGTEAIVLDAVEESLRQKLLSAEQASELLGRLKGHRGAGTLRRALMHAHPEIAETRSRLEVLFLELMTSEIDIPEPALNVRIGPVEVDVLWADVGLIVELDGRAFHIDPARFEADRERTAYLERLGYRVLRLTWRMVNFERTATVRKVRAHRRLAARDSRTPSLPGPTAPPDR